MKTIGGVSDMVDPFPENVNFPLYDAKIKASVAEQFIGFLEVCILGN